MSCVAATAWHRALVASPHITTERELPVRGNTLRVMIVLNNASTATDLRGIFKLVIGVCLCVDSLHLLDRMGLIMNFLKDATFNI